jgi:hypothetical protein
MPITDSYASKVHVVIVGSFPDVFKLKEHKKIGLGQSEECSESVKIVQEVKKSRSIFM